MVFSRRPDAIAAATERINAMIHNLREAILLVDEGMIENWVKDLVFNKTYSGLLFQEAILKAVAGLLHVDYRLATPEEEASGIDGFIGLIAVSIKPTTYSLKKSLGESIAVAMIVYDKKPDGIVVDFDL